MTLFLKRHPNGCHGSSDIGTCELEECESRLALCPTGPCMAEGSLGKVQFALDQIDHAQFVVGDPGVKEIDRLNLGETGESLRSSLVMSAEGPKGFGSVNTAVARNTSDTGGFDCLHPFDRPLEIRQSQQSLDRPAEDLTSCDRAKLAGRRPCEGLIKHGLSLFEPA